MNGAERRLAICSALGKIAVLEQALAGQLIRSRREDVR
jgi:hypothetical protein